MITQTLAPGLTPNSRSYLTHFSQPDSIVPLASQGVQAWDRFAYTNNNAIRYNDPSGHCILLCTVIGAAVGAAISGATYALTNQGENFSWGEFAVAAGGGAVAGALVGSGIGLVAGAVSTGSAAAVFSMAAVAEEVAAVSATSASLISAGTSAGVTGVSYMVQTPGNFEVAPYVIGSTASGVASYYSSGAGLLGKVGLNAAGAEITYLATAKNRTLEDAGAVALGGAASGFVDWGMAKVVGPTLDDLVRIYPTPVSRATGSFVDGLLSNAGGTVASIYAQRLALEAK